MSTTTPTKTIQTELLAITNISASAQQISSVLDVSGKFGVTIYVDISPEATNTTGHNPVRRVAPRNNVSRVSS